MASVLQNFWLRINYVLVLLRTMKGTNIKKGVPMWQQKLFEFYVWQKQELLPYIELTWAVKPEQWTVLSPNLQLCLFICQFITSISSDTMSGCGNMYIYILQSKTDSVHLEQSHFENYDFLDTLNLQPWFFKTVILQLLEGFNWTISLFI